MPSPLKQHYLAKNNSSPLAEYGLFSLRLTEEGYYVFSVPGNKDKHSYTGTDLT